MGTGIALPIISLTRHYLEGLTFSLFFFCLSFFLQGVLWFFLCIWFLLVGFFAHAVLLYKIYSTTSLRKVNFFTIPRSRNGKKQVHTPVKCIYANLLPRNYPKNYFILSIPLMLLPSLPGGPVNRLSHSSGTTLLPGVVICHP